METVNHDEMVDCYAEAFSILEKAFKKVILKGQTMQPSYLDSAGAVTQITPLAVEIYRRREKLNAYREMGRKVAGGLAPGGD